MVNPVGGKENRKVKKKANAAVGAKYLLQAKARVVCQARLFLLKPFRCEKMQATVS